MITVGPGPIAVVDDNDLERMIIVRVLAMSALDNPVVEFSSAAEFLAALAEPRQGHDQADFSLVLMDVNMPGMTGFQALPRIREDQCGRELLLAIMVASNDSEEQIARALELGADLCVAKQSGIDSFVTEIDSRFQPVSHGV